MPETSILAQLYRAPFIRDVDAQALLLVKTRQFQNLIRLGRLERAGAPKYHRITSASLRRYLVLPDVEPRDYSPWKEMLSETDSRQQNAIEREDTQGSAKTTIDPS